MVAIEFNDIELVWPQTAPLYRRDEIERLVRSELRRYIIPAMKPSELKGHFVMVSPLGPVVFVHGVPDSDAFHCLLLP